MTAEKEEKVEKLSAGMAKEAEKTGRVEMDRHIAVPMKKEEAVSLRAGDYVYLTGTIYTARDAAHKRMQEAL